MKGHRRGCPMNGHIRFYLIWCLWTCHFKGHNLSGYRCSTFVKTDSHHVHDPQLCRCVCLDSLSQANPLGMPAPHHPTSTLNLVVYYRSSITIRMHVLVSMRVPSTRPMPHLFLSRGKEETRQPSRSRSRSYRV